MKHLFIGLLVLWVFSACTPSKEDSNTINSDHKTNSTNHNEPSEQTTEAANSPTGSWIDFKTGEAMIFTPDKVYWTKQVGTKMIELGIKSKAEGKISVFFKNKPNTVYDMTFSATNDLNHMECSLGAKKLNDYEKRSENLDPQKIMDAIEASFPTVQNFKTGNAELDQLPSVADAKHLMFWFHKPKSEWTQGKKEEYPGKFKVYTRTAAKMKLSDDIVLVLNTYMRWGNMPPWCYYAQLRTYSIKAKDWNISTITLASAFQGEYCDQEDQNTLEQMMLSDNGDFIVKVKTIDKFDQGDDFENMRGTNEGPEDFKARSETAVFEIMDEYRVDAKTGYFKQTEISKKTIKQ